MRGWGLRQLLSLAELDGDCCKALMRMGAEVLDETTEKLDAMLLLVEKHLT